MAMAKCQGVYKGGKARLDRVRVQEQSRQGCGHRWARPVAQSTGLLEEVCTHRRFREAPKNALPK